ncbi:aldolase/citrate lyase family protein [Nitratireductor sp. XY-223]|uniref:HpcH/HpaI aldolase/citrate lyase family protein n=1 Tax=Nitratireductor sp. XY-223 TaxID=2561926 RepID=UPI0010A9F9C4|nr:aldolase/citrate lyase family protein [Nitratireductor sp. XY-223]
MRTIRSLLFTPASKPGWIDKAAHSGADAIILDLEDSVPASAKAEALAVAADKVKELSRAGQRVYVRINRLVHIYDFNEILRLAQPGLEGIVLPKPNDMSDIDVAHAMVSEAESRAGLPLNSIVFAAVLETANSLVLAREIARHPRVALLIAASSKNGDVSRSLGFQWSLEGLETLYLRSSAVAAARAAGKLAIGGLWQDVHDLKGLSSWAAFNRQLGFHGELALHPSNVPVINAAFSPSQQDIEYYTDMIAAFGRAQAEGKAAVVFRGEHIDHAHVKTANEILEYARNLDRS